MTELLDSTRIYVHSFTWHLEGDCVIIRKKLRMREPVILNSVGSSLWKIIQNGQWTVGKFIAAVEDKLALERQTAGEVATEFLTSMIQEGVITTRRVALFPDRDRVGGQPGT